MSNSGNIPELQDLEPLDQGAEPAPEAAEAAVSTDDALLQSMRSGLGAPAFNLYCRDKAYYRFLFAGVVMLLGCLMPFGPNPDLVGYKTMSGAVFTLIALGMVWTWWGAIANNRSTAASLKWLLLCFIPFGAGVMNLMAFNADEALKVAIAQELLPSTAMTSTWGTLFADIGTGLSKKVEAAEAAQRVEHFFRLFGPGRFFVFLGALLAEFGFVAGIVGGAKKNKQDKIARQSGGTERRRR